MPDAPAHTTPRKRRGWQGPGPGRKSLNDPTKTVAVPLAILAEVERLIAEHRGRRNALLKAKADTPRECAPEPLSAKGTNTFRTLFPKAAPEPVVMTPFEAGRVARQAGLMLAANPHGFGTPERADWARGWWSPKT